jgi:hypothetical protein
MPDLSKLNTDDVIDAAERQMFGDENPGFCLECGQEQGGCEPDAREYPCESCGATASVYGAQELLMMGIG